MKIAFVSPAWTTVFGPFSQIGNQASSYPPLGLCYLAALARDRGHEVKLIDAEIEMLGVDQVVDATLGFSPDLIGITSTTPIFHIAKVLAEKLKKASSLPILIGGPHISYFKENLFDKNFDFHFIGESERSFVEFLDCFEKNRNFSSVKGIVYRDRGRNVFTGNAERTDNLDELPFPARNLLLVHKYVTNTVRHGTLHYTSILPSRGCPFKCVYCAATELLGSKVRMSSIKRVLDEVEHVINNFSIRHFNFLSENLTLNRKYTLDFCGEIEKRKLNFTWEGSTRANLIDEELIAVMAENGLIRISFGLESGDPEVLKIIKKGVSLESLEKANKITARCRVETINSAMLGLPGETKKKVWKTVNFIRNAKTIQHATFSIAMPYPGTEFFEMAKRGKYGLKLHTEDFSKYQRYGSAVLSVNDMSPEDIINLQKLALLKIYFSPYKFKQIIRRFKFRTLILPFFSALGVILVSYLEKLKKLLKLKEDKK